MTITFEPWQKTECILCSDEFQVSRTGTVTYENESDIICDCCETYKRAHADGYNEARAELLSNTSNLIGAYKTGNLKLSDTHTLIGQLLSTVEELTGVENPYIAFDRYGFENHVSIAKKCGDEIKYLDVTDDNWSKAGTVFVLNTNESDTKNPLTDPAYLEHFLDVYKDVDKYLSTLTTTITMQELSELRTYLRDLHSDFEDIARTLIAMLRNVKEIKSNE